MIDLSEIVDACRRGDRNAQSLIYKKCWSIIYPSVYLILRNREEAEDVMQDGFIKGFNKLNDLKESAKFIGWQKSICIREALDRIRRRKDFHVFLPEIKDTSESTSDYDHENDVTVEQVKASMRKLSEGAQLIIQLFVIEGMTHAQIAEQLGIEHSACRTQYSRALAKLRNTINISA